MSDAEPVTPQVDPEPEAIQNPGGTDAVDNGPEDFPLATPEPPVSAQLGAEGVPDELARIDEKVQEGATSGPDDDTSTEPA